MTNNHTTRENAITGALIADAAAMGLHWLYDQKRIATLAGNAPAFFDSTETDYEGVPSYYAHATKSPGDFSQYGEQAMVMLKSLATNNGQYEKSHYEQTFCSTFGYGGTYVGYIDRPTRDTLDAVAQADKQAVAHAKSLPFSGTESDQQAMINKVLANLRQQKTENIMSAVEAAVRVTHDDNAMVQYAQSLIEPLSAATAYHGAHDDQLPAISKLPALIAVFCHDHQLDDMIDSAVRVTNNHPLSIECGLVMSKTLCSAMSSRSMDDAIASLAQCTGDQILPIIRSALERNTEPSTEVIADIGMACNLTLGMPGAFHVLRSTESYKDAVQTNIYAGGDSCGRAILIGAVAGAVYGVGGDRGIPVNWIDRLNRLSEVNRYLNSLNV